MSNILLYIAYWIYMSIRIDKNTYKMSQIHGLSCSILCFISIYFQRQHLIETIGAFSTGYFLVDLYYNINYNKSILFFVHHVLSIYFLNYICNREYHVSQLTLPMTMIIEYANYFTMEWIQEKSCRKKWIIAFTNFILSRVIYLNYIIFKLKPWERPLDEKVISCLFVGANLFWALKMFKRKSFSMFDENKNSNTQNNKYKYD